MAKAGTEYQALLEGVRKGDVRSIARAISLVENPGKERLTLLQHMFETHGNAYKIGITGAPGAGKSSLMQQLIPRFTEQGHRVGVLAIDPTSPFSGGAILGDRIRMQEQIELAHAYMRSLASRGSMGGLSRGVNAALHVLEAAGYDLVLIETVGSGQLQVDVRYVADTVLLTLVPEAGDEIQAMKGGIIEIADLYIVNKADREGAPKMRRDLRGALELGDRHTEWNPPIALTEAINGTGIDEVIGFVKEHRAYLQTSGEGERRRLQQLRWEMKELVQEALEIRAQHHMEHLFDPMTIQRIYAHEENPYPRLAQIWQLEDEEEGHS
jgi:LAO/AO transport system kinase